MQAGMFQFRPGRIPTLATLLTLPILVLLGFWQLDRAEQKEQALAAFDARALSPALVLNRDNPDPEGDLFRLAEARGRYDTHHQFLLDNQTRNRQVGYQVLTPFRLEGRKAAVLVDRGWVRSESMRADLPSVPAPGDVTTVSGHLDQGPATGIRLGGIADGEQGWPLRVQYVDYEELEARLDYPLMPVVLRLDESAEGGYLRSWRPEHPAGFGPERNRGYAFQWFGLAATLAIIYIAVNTRRRRGGEHEHQ
ncbi:MAG: SURF1 family protein [Aquisalimonadaceae bacterium]